MAVNTSIWKDTSYAVNYSASPFTYRIDMKTGSTASDVTTIFNGKSWVRPGETYLYININKIAQDYLNSDLPDLRDVTASTTVQNVEAFRTFYLKNASGTTLETYNFLLDWSYEDTYNPSDTVYLSEPINGHGTNGMLFMRSVLPYANRIVTTTISPSPFSYSPGSSYDTTHCGDFAIYYLSTKGGWCSFLFEGTATQTDKYKRYDISVPFNNTTLEFQKKTYHNEITTTYQLKTGKLSDSEAANLAKNLIGTNKAYLHNLKTGEIMPVLSVDGSAVYKTYKNQGRKIVTYTVNVECSQTKHNVN